MNLPTTNFKDLTDKYLTWSGEHHGKCWHERIARILQGDLLPHWTDTPIIDIRRANGIQLVRSVAARAHHAAAVSTVLRSVFDFALDEGLIEANPMIGLTKYVPKPTAKPRSRVLSGAEIRAVWEAISEGPGNEASKRALKLMMVTGQRPGAIVGMARNEINGECWTIAAGRSLSRPHRVYLTPLALDLIGEQDGAIFPAADGTPITTNALTRLLRHKGHKPFYGVDKWTPYDLRRTVIHHMGRLGISRSAIEAVMGNQAVDFRHRIVPTHHAEVKEALTKWEAELLRLLPKKENPPPPSITTNTPIFGL